MSDNAFILTAIIVSFLFEGAFYLTLGMIYQSIEKKRFNILNTFIFETTPRFKEKNSAINYLFLFAMLVNLFPFIFYAARNLNSYSVSIMILSVLSLFCLACIPFIPFNKLREHFYLDLGAIVTTLAVFGLEAFYCYYLYHNFLNNFALAGMIIAIVFAALLLIAIFNPKLFDLTNKQNEDGTYSRKKFIFLAFTEWMIYLFMLVSLVPIYLITK